MNIWLSKGVQCVNRTKNYTQKGPAWPRLLTRPRVIHVFFEASDKQSDES